MKKHPRHKTNPKLALRIARAQLRAIRSVTPAVALSADPSRFVQCWAVSGRPVTQALDASGHVWERHTVGKKVDGVWVTEDSWWQPLSMKRKEG